MSNVDRSIRTAHRPYHAIKAPWACTDREDRDDLENVKAIVCAYRKTWADRSSDTGTIWDTIFNSIHQELHEALLNGSMDDCAEILRNPSANNLFYGFDNLVKDWTDKLKSDDIHPSGYAIRCYDNLLRLAEAMGVLPIDNPEDERNWLRHANMHADDILDKIERYIGFPLKFPNPFPNEFGLKTSRGVCSYRSIHALYLGWRVKTLTHNLTRPRVLEIGAGLGKSAYFSQLFGIYDYTVVDLPFSSVSQGYFLITTLGREKVSLYAESNADMEKRVKVLSIPDFFKSNDHYDLIVNMDSLTEFGPKSAKMYYEKICKCTDKFLSVNHESNDIRVFELIQLAESRVLRSDRYPYRVADIYKPVTPRMQQVMRYPSWLRPGYVEEIVEFSN